MVLFAGSLLPYTQYVIMFTSGFMCIPTGRDFFAPGYQLMPGDDKLLPAMMSNPFAWKVFGVNFIFLSIIKFMVLMMGIAAINFFILFAVYASIAVGLLVTYKGHMSDQGADITPFLALFTLECIAWWLTVLF